MKNTYQLPLTLKNQRQQKASLNLVVKQKCGIHFELSDFRYNEKLCNQENSDSLFRIQSTCRIFQLNNDIGLFKLRISYVERFYV